MPLKYFTIDLLLAIVENRSDGTINRLLGEMFNNRQKAFHDRKIIVDKEYPAMVTGAKKFGDGGIISCWYRHVMFAIIVLDYPMSSHER